MKEYNDLNIEDQLEVYNKAFTWLHDHVDHVHNLFDKKTPCIPPSGSDMFHPELWKDIHWAWFLNKERIK